MTFSEYQTQSHTTNKYPGSLMLLCLSLGIGSEVGELQVKIKKYFRGDNVGDLNEMCKAELGDILWYLSELALLLEIPLDDVAEANIAKLKDRMERNVINGSGDKR